MNKQHFSPEKYIRQNGRKLPIEKCLIADKYDIKGFTFCLLIRRQPSGLFSFAHFLVDRLCLGIKDCMYGCNLHKTKMDEIFSKLKREGEFIEVSPVYFHNMVYGAHDFAEDLGFKPNKDFHVAEYLLDPNLANECIDDIEFGYNGKPLYIQGPYDDPKRIIKTLNNSVGEGNYEYLMD